MSSFYLDVLKDRLYTSKSESEERRAAQWVLYQILSTMTRLMAPVLSFTAEELWQSMQQKAKSKERRAKSTEESVFLTPFPEVDEKYHDKELEKKWGEFFLLRDEVNKALEMKRAERFIGNSLEGKVILYLSESKEQKFKTLIAQYKDFLPTFFIVSSVEIMDKGLDGSYKSENIEGLEVKVERAPGAKCQRCWNWRETVGQSKDVPEICDRCYKVIFG
jgi:isoleucyl-tRNA synthetase